MQVTFYHEKMVLDYIFEEYRKMDKRFPPELVNPRLLSYEVNIWTIPANARNSVTNRCCL